MAAAFSPSMNLYSLFSFLIILSAIPHYFSQPQNIQTFYPFPLPPLEPPQIPTRPVQPPSPPTLLPPSPPPPPLLSPPPSSPSSTKKAVGTAIGVTAAGALVLSGIFFFLLVRYSRSRRESGSAAATNPYADPYPNPYASRPADLQDEFSKIGGKVKGVIVDEEGLDVLYWRKLESADAKGSFKKQVFSSISNGEKVEEKRMIIRSSSRKKPGTPIHEIPLLRGKSSTSQDPAWGEAQNKAQARPTSAGIVLESVEKQESQTQPESRSPPLTPSPPLPPPPLSVQAISKAPSAPPPPPPPPALPVQTVSKASSAPPPPPPAAPPLPVQAIPNAPSAAPPPLPAVAKKKSLPPPPPLNPSGFAALSKSQKPPPPQGMPSDRPSSEQGTSGNGKEQVKLKPLHWDKVNANADHSMVWNKIEGGSFKFDGDLMEALFGHVAINRKSPQSDSSSPDQKRNIAAGPTPQIFILDTRKSQNTAIVLKSLGVPRKEIIDALNEGQGLNAETLEKLCRVAPTREEESEILNFAGDPTRLADAESFLFHMLKAIPSAFTRFNAMLFRSNYGPEILQLNESLLTLEWACNELRGQRLFMKLLEAILKAGNRMNAGTSRGDAQAFNLTALRKLSDVKSIDGKTTLLHFVVQEVVRAEGKRCVLNCNHSLSKNSNQTSSIASSDYDKEKEYIMLGLPIVGGLSSEFSNVKKAAAIDYDVLSKTCLTLSSQASEIRKLVAQCGAAGGGFATEMKNFLDDAEGEIKAARDHQKRVMEFVKRTTDYYQAGTSNNKAWQPLQLFVIIRDFLGMVDRVCVEIARNLQKKKPEGPGAGSSSLTTESPSRAVRFPKLPANFLSEQ